MVIYLLGLDVKKDECINPDFNLQLLLFDYFYLVIRATSRERNGTVFVRD